MARWTNTATPIGRESRPVRRDDFFSPFNAIRQMQDEMSRLFGSFMGTPGAPEANRPAVDFYEEGNDWVVEAEVPGFDPDDIDVQVNPEGLEISGQTSSEQETRDKGYYRTERSYGSFRRFIPLPGEVDPEQVKANYRNGVLEVRMPKPELSASRRIPVESSEGNSTGK